MRPAPVTPSVFRNGINPSAQSAEYDYFYSKVLDRSAICAQCDQPLLEGLLEGALTPAHACNLCDNYKSDPEYPQSDLALLSQGEESNASTATSVLLIPSDQTQILLPFESMPTKIKALLANLSENCPAEKW
jgi:hypothetical protein